MILPSTSLAFRDLNEVPDVLILPAQKGISVSMQCDQKQAMTVHCVPKKFNQGSLTCSLASGSPSIAASVVKSKRSAVVKDSNLISLKTLWQDLNKNTRPIWSSLAPEIFSCTTSIAGCDFCFYYLSTYNLSVAPAACVGGCSLGAFGSCSKLISSSLIKTLDLK